MRDQKNEYQSLSETIYEIREAVTAIEKDFKWFMIITKWAAPIIIAFGAWSATNIMELQTAYAKISTELRRVESTKPKRGLK